MKLGTIMLQDIGLNGIQGDQIGRFFSNGATIGSSESSPKNATFSFLFA
jgi:hypothetical protein